MTVEVLTAAPGYVISGVGPYTVPHPYRAAEDLLVAVNSEAAVIPLLIGEDYDVAPGTSTTGGNLTLSAAAAAAYPGWTLSIERFTEIEQGWLGLRGPREKGLERQLDLLAMGLQDYSEVASRALRLPIGSTLDPRLPEIGVGRSLVVNETGTGFAAGPTVDEIADAAANAELAERLASLSPRVIWAETVQEMLALDVGSLELGQQVSVRRFDPSAYGGGVFVLGATSVPDGGTEIATGVAGRSWHRIDKQIVSLADFSGNAAALNAYTSALVGAADAVQYGVVLHPGRGLSMLEFMASAGPFVDQRAALQAAINKLLTSNVYTCLDLCGRTWTIADQLDVDVDLLISVFQTPKIITNGKISCDGGLWPSVGKAAIRLWRSSGSAVEMARIHITNVLINCANVASGIDIVGNYRDIKIRMCDFRGVKTFAVRHRYPGGSGTAGNLRLEYNDVAAADASTVPFAERTLIGFDLESAGDGKILGNRVQYAMIALRANMGSTLVAHNHFFQGISNPSAASSDVNPVIEASCAPNSIIVHNYLDNGHVRFTEDLFNDGLNTAQGHVLMAFNLHTMVSSDKYQCFVQFKPKSSGCVLTNFKCVYSQFRVIGSGYGQRMESPFRISYVAGGNWSLSDCMNSDIIDNYFWGGPGVQPQSTRISRRFTLSPGVTSIPVDLTGQTPFGLQVNYLDAAPGVVSSSGSYGCCWYERTDGYTGALKLATGVTGEMLAKFTVNRRSQFDA